MNSIHVLPVSFAGFIPIWARFAPTTTLQLVIFENIKPVFGVTDSSGAGG
jgi:hypothetical protein